MSGPSKVIVLDPDPQAGRQIQLGLSREGVPTHLPAVPPEPAQLADLASEVPGLVLIGGVDGQAIALVRRARELLGPDVPIISTARGATRADLEAAGADEVVGRPSYLRDLVTICRILRGVPAGKRDHLVGSLVETTGVYTLVRALSSLGRSAVLTLIRGLRRGEVRFYRGEVTSAEVGLIHGQAALHQLLLWTDARFDFAHEDIVRRQQIPLTPDELFADAERFLEGVREHAGALSPATVLEQDIPRIQFLGKQVPTEVHGVLRMFDGHRVLADILEDSPYRVFETLRVAQKALEVGLLKPVDTQRPKATWRAVLAIDEWLVGDTREAVVERTAEIDSGPVSTAKRKGKGKSRKRSKAATPPAGNRAEIDWGALVPRIIGAEVGPLAGVVPSQAAAGEVTIATRDRQREKLEALMDTDKRDRIFPTEIGLEPKVVIADDAAPTAKSSEAETLSGKKKKKRKTDKSGPTSKETPPPGSLDEAAARANADSAKAEADASEQRAKEIAEQNAREAEAEAREAQAKAREAEAQAKEAAALAEKIAREAEAKAREADAKAREAAEAAEQQARVAASVERMRLDRIAREEAEAKAREEAARAAAAEEARTYAARVKAAAEAKREEAERVAREKAIAEAEGAARAKAETEAREAAAREKAESEAREAAARAKAESDARELAEAAARAKAETEAREAAARAKAESEAREAAAQAKAETEAREAAARAKSESDAREAAAREKAETEAREAAARKKAETDAREAEAAARPKAESDARELAEGAARAKAESDARELTEGAARAKAESDARELAEGAARAKAESDARELAEAAARETAEAATRGTAEPAPIDRTDARELVRGLVAEALPPTTTGPVIPEPSILTTPPAEASAISTSTPTNVSDTNAVTTSADDDAATTAFVRPEIEPESLGAPDEPVAPVATAPTVPIEVPSAPLAPVATAPTVPVEVPSVPVAVATAPTAPVAAARAVDDPIRAHIAQPLNIIEAGHTRVAVADLVTVTTTDNTARVTSVPKVLISEEPELAQVASTTPAMTASSTSTTSTATSESSGSTSNPANGSATEKPKRPSSISDATPEETDDEPSDGVVRAMIATADTARARLNARRARPPAPEHDGPAVKEATGEIRERTPKNDVSLRRSEPSILVADLVNPQTVAEVAAASTASDLAAAHKAIAAVVDKPAPARPADSATPKREAEVGDVRKDAVAFSDAEEAFFNRAESGTNMVPKFESFDDLDEDYQPVGFWDRLFGRTKPKKK